MSAAACTARTTCPYCGVGCGIVATRARDGAVTVKGDPDHPANFGRLCSKGTALAETLALDDRLLHPVVDGANATWDRALDRVAHIFSTAIATHGSDSVAFYVSGQILTEDYYVANKLMKGFIGSGNIDTNSRLCMASSVAGHRRAFGADTVPGTYQDLELADLVVLVGSNLAWCHPVLYQRLEAARATRGTKVVVIDPRATATCAIADMHLAIAPQSDVALFSGLLAALAERGAVDHAYVNAHTSGFEGAFAVAKASTCAAVGRATGLSEREIAAFYALFASTEKVVTVFSQGVNQATDGTDKVNAIINCHLATARIGKPGMGPFSVTGQPNAMGGREVGGLANMLAAHMEIENADHRALVQDFWQAPRVADKPGLKAVDLFRAVDDGSIKALWVMATNPVDSMPDADMVKRALARCPFVVVSDVVARTDTTAYAHVLLPSLAWGEKSGTVTNSERRISRQRAFLPAPGEAKADWWQMAEVAKRMGYARAFTYAGEHAIFDEYARLSATGNDGRRDFDIGGVANLDMTAYNDLQPFQWPRVQEAPTETRFFGDGGFFTPDRRGRFVATPVGARAVTGGSTNPLVLNTGRVRDQWHTMTRTGKSARLMSHSAEPFVDISPGDARDNGIEDGRLAEIENGEASIVVRARVTDMQRDGSIFVPIHWTGQLAGAARVGALIPAAPDPVSGQPALKQARVSIKPFPVVAFGLAVSEARPSADGLAQWTLVRIASGWRLEFALKEAVSSAADVLVGLLGDGADATRGDTITYGDAKAATYRAARFDGQHLRAAVFLGPAPLTVQRGWLADAIGREHADRRLVLAGRGGAAVADKGPIVCACFDVGRTSIVGAKRAGCTTVEAIGKALAAGTNCGSCRSEIAGILAAT